MTYHYHSLSQVLDFGKHSGETVEQVIYNSPGYLLWCRDNIRGFEISEELEDLCLDRQHELEEDRNWGLTEWDVRD